MKCRKLCYKLSSEGQNDGYETGEGIRYPLALLTMASNLDAPPVV